MSLRKDYKIPTISQWVHTEKKDGNLVSFMGSKMLSLSINVVHNSHCIPKSLSVSAVI